MLFYNPIRNLESVKTLRHQQPKLQGRETVFPVLFDCCTEVAHHIPRRWLRTVATFDIQNGAVGKKKMCVCVVCVQLWNGENDLRTLTNWNMSRGGQPKWSKAWKRCLMRNG
uniref:Uncharacterized protein n=1 Tax=Podarcis muralis TaxID=64176 RepID=A0A670JQW2_PODMU